MTVVLPAAAVISILTLPEMWSLVLYPLFQCKHPGRKSSGSIVIPLFQQYRQKQPFNQNHLRPCPCLDNPDRLKEMVLEAGARSTQAGDEEPVEELTDKCREAARKWAAVADELWRESQRQKRKKKSRE